MTEYKEFEIDGTKVRVIDKDNNVITTLNLLQIIDEYLSSIGYEQLEY